MTEDEWMNIKPLDGFDCRWVIIMSRSTLPSQRKQRLFCVACCNYFWDRLSDRCKPSLVVAEKYADSLVSSNELQHAFVQVYNSRCWTGFEPENPRRISNLISYAASSCCMGNIGEDHLRNVVYNTALDQCMDLWQPHLFRSMVKPFKEIHDYCPTKNTVQLAESLYSGYNVVEPLHDSLLDEGQNALAEEFKEPYKILNGKLSNYPKGYWALDYILGKK